MIRFVLSILILTAIITIIANPLIKRLVSFVKDKNNKLEDDE